MTDATSTSSSRSVWTVLFDAIRGFLIGMAELVPGISGGTVALIVGVYEKALHSADLFLRRKFREIDWVFILSIGIAMVAAVFSMSTVLHGLVTTYPAESRALFFGMVAVSIIVPIGMMDRRTMSWKLLWLFIPGAILGFWATGFSSGTPVSDPSLWAVFGAAMVAICALMIPGLSGSFVLIALGLYEPILGALSDRNWTVILVFAAGALTGAVLFVRILNWLLEKHRNTTLALMSGLMLGSLRVLWPWSGYSPDNTAGIIGMMVLGGVIVAIFIYADYALTKRKKSQVVETVDATSSEAN